MFLYSTNNCKYLRIFSTVFRNSYAINGVDTTHSRDSINLEKDIFTTLSGLKRLHVFKTTRFWSSIKSAGSAIYANRHYLEMYRDNNISRLATNGPNKPKIIGDVFIHPSANVDPTAVVRIFFV